MTITATVYEIAALIAALAFVAFIIFLIPALIQLRRTIKAVEDLTSESKRTLESVNAIIRIAEGQAGNIEEVVKKLTDVGTNIAGLLNLIVDNIKHPLVSLISLIFGMESGFRNFFSRSKKGGGDDGKQ